MALTLENIIDKFKNRLDAGDKLKEIISPNESIGQIRIEEGNSTIQLRWELKNNTNDENRIISFKPTKIDQWNIMPINQIKNGIQEQINNKFSEIKKQILNNKEVNKDGMQRNEKANNKENNKEINNIITEIDDIKIETYNKIIEKEINTIDKNDDDKPIVKKSKGRPKKIVK
jgi:hypothetical protein